jgi:dipeptidyl aminopeptidase/acylaminoacyl peptidase
MAVDQADRVRVPVLLQHGSKDRTVPAEQARFMEAALREAGNADVTRLEYPELGHAFWFWEAVRHTPEEMRDAERAWRDLAAFLARCLGAP